MAGEIITKAGLADRLGVSRARVSQLVAQGMPVLPDGSVDFQAAIVWISARTDRSRNVGRAPKSAAPPPTAQHRMPTEQPDPGTPRLGVDAGQALLVARARKALAETRRIERLEKIASREVIAAEEAREYATTFSQIVRDATISQADRLTEAVMAAAAEGDRERVYRAIREDGHRMLEQLSKAIANAGL